jgi:hypothetical protein
MQQIAQWKRDFMRRWLQWWRGDSGGNGRLWRDRWLRWTAEELATGGPTTAFNGRDVIRAFLPFQAFLPLTLQAFQTFRAVAID